MPASGRSSSTPGSPCTSGRSGRSVEAREALERLVGHLRDWVTLDTYLVRYMVEPSMRPTVLASALSATLEMVREGTLAMRQDGPFAPLWVQAALANGGRAVEPEGWTSARTSPRGGSRSMRPQPDRRRGHAHRRGAAVRRRRAAWRGGPGAACPKAPTSRRSSTTCSAVYAARASTSSGSPANGRSARRATCPSCWRATWSSRRSCPARRHGDAGHHRLSPARDPGRDRGDPRRRDLQGHPRHCSRDRLDPPARAAQGAGPARDLRHDAGLPGAFRPRRDRRPAGSRGAERGRLHRGPPAGRLSVPVPSDAEALREDEDPLDATS